MKTKSQIEAVHPTSARRGFLLLLVLLLVAIPSVTPARLCKPNIKRILDLGAGPGCTAAALADAG